MNHLDETVSKSDWTGEEDRKLTEICQRYSGLHNTQHTQQSDYLVQHVYKNLSSIMETSSLSLKPSRHVHTYSDAAGPPALLPFIRTVSLSLSLSFTNSLSLPLPLPLSLSSLSLSLSLSLPLSLPLSVPPSLPLSLPPSLPLSNLNHFHQVPSPGLQLPRRWCLEQTTCVLPGGTPSATATRY